MNLVDLQTLAMISVLTTLATQAIKVMFDKGGFNYVSNIIAAIVAVVISAFVVIVYPYMNGVQITSQIVCSGIATAFCAVLCACISYDKVIQTLRDLNN